MRGLRRDRWLFALSVVLVADTTAAMVLSLAGGGRRSPAGQVLAGLWLLLLAALAWRAALRIRGLNRLVSTREGRIEALAATSHEWGWEATPSLGPPVSLLATWCSPAVAEMLGVSATEVVGRSLLDFVSEEDRGRAAAVLTAALREGRGWNDVPLTWRHADGHMVEMLGTALPVFDRRGHLVAFRGSRRLDLAGRLSRGRQSEISARLDQLMASGGPTIALQPIVAVEGGRWVAVEALSRFPDGRPPDVWFAEAHEVDRGIELELAAVARALGVIPSLPADVTLAVNASPGLITDRRLRDLLMDSGVDLCRVAIEVTEHTAITHYEDIHSALRPLRASGLHLAVDDTGAGYASFAHVLRLRPDSVKLDRSLIAGIDSDPARRAFVTAVVLLALELHSTVAAEGVETPGELAVLASLGVDHAQGYLLARPTVEPARWASWPDPSWRNDPGIHSLTRTVRQRAANDLVGS